jgi:hypothetical protein
MIYIHTFSNYGFRNSSNEKILEATILILVMGEICKYVTEMTSGGMTYIYQVS